MSVGLILKTIPQTCMGCQFNPNYDLCVAATREIEIDPYGKSRPDWRPLQEVEPVRHGMWHEKIATFGDYVYEVCSVCGEERYMESLYPDEAGYYYCPNCGAKMEGVRFD